ncbi:hypothetical protein [Caldimonas sp. KR1-144]|uniref:hypothetical protein n=1 Tax=Caldimonas sp. KR1-144 TaxID=3400911 RepID=UPI003C022B46
MGQQHLGAWPIGAFDTRPIPWAVLSPGQSLTITFTPAEADYARERIAASLAWHMQHEHSAYRARLEQRTTRVVITRLKNKANFIQAKRRFKFELKTWKPFELRFKRCLPAHRDQLTRELEQDLKSIRTKRRDPSFTITIEWTPAGARLLRTG